MLMPNPRRPASRKPKSRERGRRTRRATTKPRKRAINTVFKGLLAVEPPIDDDPMNLSKVLRVKLEKALARLSSEEKPFKLVEGYRTLDRQQWLYGSGRASAIPYGRPGPVVTNADGVI